MSKYQQGHKKSKVHLDSLTTKNANSQNQQTTSE